MHIAIIMDGNRRFAAANNLARIIGHAQGADNLGKIMQLCPKYGVHTLTVYALSGENLTKRSVDEVSNLVDLITKMARSYKRKLIGQNVRVKIMGKLKSLPSDLQTAVEELVESTKDGTKLLLQICLNYGGRAEIVDAVNNAIASGQTLITEELITQNLYSANEPDLIIRPGGELRLSNFLPWQGVYSELYFTETLWPDFGEAELAKAVEFYQSRQRRFGG